MWQETAIFSSENKLLDVLEWANKQSHSVGLGNFRGRLQLTIGQNHES